MSEEHLTSAVIPGILQVAKELNLPVIDLHAALSNRPDLFHNSVHPVGEANKYIASAIYTGVFGINPPGALVAAPTVFPGKNLLEAANPGAEADTPSWTSKGGKLSYVTDLFHAGKRAAKLSERKGEADSLGLDITTALNAAGSGDFCFRAFARQATEPADKKRAQCWISINYTDDKGSHSVGSGVRHDFSAKDWTSCGGTGAVRWTGTLKSATLLVTCSGTTDLVVDDFELGKFTYTPPAK